MSPALEYLIMVAAVIDVTAEAANKGGMYRQAVNTPSTKLRRHHV